MEDAFRYQRCLVGGTFDRLHAGHRLLLDAAQRAAAHVEIHITSNAMAEHKSSNIQSFESRREEVLVWVERHAPHRVTVHELTDVHGPAPTHPSADCIVATPETIGQCRSINEKREEIGLSPLSIIEVSHFQDHLGGILSSSRIRNGQIDPEGHSWFSPEWMEKTLRMHPRAEPELKTPMGVLYEGPESTPEVAMSSALDEMDGAPSLLIAVGDVTVGTLLSMDIVPDIGFIDGQTKRQALETGDQVSLEAFDHVLHAVNPAGQLTPSLFQAVQAAVGLEGTVAVVVEGEEDLAPLFIHLMVPLDSMVLYGQPKVGVVVQTSHLATKERCRRLLELFEVM